MALNHACLPIPPPALNNSIILDRGRLCQGVGEGVRKSGCGNLKIGVWEPHPLKSAILTSPHPHPLKNKTPIGYPYPHDDKHQTSQDRTTRWALPPHTPSRPPPTTPPHHTSQHHTTRTLPHPPTTHPRRTPHPRTQNHRPTRTHPTPLPQPHPQPLLPTLPTLLRPRRRLPAPVPPYPPRRPHRPPLHHRP
jgi:hypothetical protein